MTQLVIGASGQVGGHLLKELKSTGNEVVGTYYRHPFASLAQLNLCRPADTKNFITKLEPDIIYLPASLANADYCELHPDEAFEVNVKAVKHVVAATNEIGARLVYLSSDYVFDGTAGPYAEDDEPNPISVYGRQKLQAEGEIAQNAADFLIVRTTVIYGWEPQGKNFIYRLLNALRRNERIDIPQDQIGNPTYAPNLARAIIELAQHKRNGIYNVVGPELGSRYDFACEAARVFGFSEKLVNPVSSDRLKQTARRPLKAGLRVTKTAATASTPLISYHEGLRLMASEVEVTL